LLIDRLDGRPLAGQQGVKITAGSADVTERFSPGTYITLSDSEALNRPPFDVLPSGRVLSLADPALSESAIPDGRTVWQIVITPGGGGTKAEGRLVDLVDMVAIVSSARRGPALSDATPLLTAAHEVWAATSTADAFSSATAAHQFVRYHAGIAQASADAKVPVNTTGV